MNREHSDCGFKIVTGAATVATGQYFGVLVLEEAVIDEVTFQEGYLGHDAIEGVTLAAGLYVPMRFTTLTLTSGTVYCGRES